MTRVKFIGALITASSISLICLSCAGARSSPAPRPFQAPEDEVSFLHYLAAAPVVTVEEGARAIELLIGPGDAGGASGGGSSFERMVATGMIQSSWRLRPTSILDKGTLAYMLRCACKLPRGVNEVMLGSTGIGDRRYAMQTVVYEGLMPHDQPQKPVTGGELLSALRAAEERSSCGQGEL